MVAYLCQVFRFGPFLSAVILAVSLLCYYAQNCSALVAEDFVCCLRLPVFVFSRSLGGWLCCYSCWSRGINLLLLGAFCGSVLLVSRCFLSRGFLCSISVLLVCFFVFCLGSMCPVLVLFLPFGPFGGRCACNSPSKSCLNRLFLLLRQGA